MSDPWNERAQLYVESDAHRGGEDLDQMVAWASGAATPWPSGRNRMSAP